jgi:hypothetical protein
MDHRRPAVVADLIFKKIFRRQRGFEGGGEDEFSRATSLATLDDDSDVGRRLCVPFLVFFFGTVAIDTIAKVHEPLLGHVTGKPWKKCFGD